MQLFLVRHGEAVDERVDIRRPLTARGVAEVSQVARYLRKNDFRVEKFFHSTKERARQTADIIRREVNPPAHLEEKKYLSPMDAPDEALKEIGQLTQNTLVAGHMPFLALLVNRLVGSDEQKDVVRFATGAVVILEHDPSGKWDVTAAFSPAEIT